MIISGKFKWKVSAIEKIAGDKVFVKWINEAKRATKGKGFLIKHLPIHVSNVMYYAETRKNHLESVSRLAKDGKEN